MVICPFVVGSETNKLTRSGRHIRRGVRDQQAWSVSDQLAWGVSDQQAWGVSDQQAWGVRDQ